MMFTMVCSFSLIRLCCFIVSIYQINCHSGDSDIERHYKTEFETPVREPRSFTDFQYETLSVRINGFKSITRYDKNGGHHDDHVGNWELFALRYWFETRSINSSCPMQPHGIAARVDWSLMVPCMFGDPYKPPRTIFVHHYMLSHFIESTLRFMDKSYRFVLLSGGTDLTIPRSTDVRYSLLRGFNNDPSGGRYFQELVKSPQLIHWFCENHDLEHPKISTLPTGLFPKSGNPDDFSDFPPPESLLPVNERQPAILNADKVRTGSGQWQSRANVVNLCREIPDLCVQPHGNMYEGISHAEFLQLLGSVPFVACVHGGGIDPSPKAWEAMMLGTIPIIQSSTLDDAYAKFPIIIHNSWKGLLKSPYLNDSLIKWAEKLKPYYEHGSILRESVLYRLKTKFWLEEIDHHIRKYDESMTKELNDRYNNLEIPSNSTPPNLRRNMNNDSREEDEERFERIRNYEILGNNLAIFIDVTQDMKPN